MYTCSICEKSYRKSGIIPSCCQQKSESQYALCKRCLKKCTRCPFCRSEKTVDVLRQSLVLEIEYMVRVHAVFRIACENIAAEIGNLLYPHPFADKENSHIFYQTFRQQCISIVTGHDHEISDIVDSYNNSHP